MRPGVEITEASFELFIRYAKDAGNWSGTPLVDDGGNTGATAQANRGNLTQLKKAGLVTTFRSDGCNWLDFTDEGKRFAAINDVDYFESYRPRCAGCSNAVDGIEPSDPCSRCTPLRESPLTDAVLEAAKELGVEVVTSELAATDPQDFKGLPWFETDVEIELGAPVYDYETIAEAEAAIIGFVDMNDRLTRPRPLLREASRRYGLATIRERDAENGALYYVARVLKVGDVIEVGNRTCHPDGTSRRVDPPVIEVRSMRISTFEEREDGISITYVPCNRTNSVDCGFGSVLVSKDGPKFYGWQWMRVVGFEAARPRPFFTPQPGDTGYDLMC